MVKYLILVMGVIIVFINYKKLKTKSSFKDNLKKQKIEIIKNTPQISEVYPTKIK